MWETIRPIFSDEQWVRLGIIAAVIIGVSIVLEIAGRISRYRHTKKNGKYEIK